MSVQLYPDFPPKSADKIEIDSFRGLKKVALEELGQVNLLVGGNNSGKTSILEAIAVLHAGKDIRKWLDVAFAREVRTFAPAPNSMPIIDVFGWMFPSNDNDLWDHSNAGKIHLKAETVSGNCQVLAEASPISGYLPDEELRKIGYRGYLGEQDGTGDPVHDTGLEIALQYEGPQDKDATFEKPEVFHIWSRIGLRLVSRRGYRDNSVQYIPPYGHRSSSNNLSALSKAQRGDSIGELNQLMSALDPRISGVELVPSENRHRPVIAIRLKDRSLVPASVMGDGVRRGLSIALSILAAKNGVVLIDEMEAGFHVSAFSQVFNWLMLAAKRHNVQVFATTHSLEAVEEISRSNGDAVGLSAYLVGNDSGQVAKRFTSGMLQRLVVESGMDIRF